MHKILREGLGGSTCPGSVGGLEPPPSPTAGSVAAQNSNTLLDIWIHFLHPRWQGTQSYTCKLGDHVCTGHAMPHVLAVN